jgi:hypothetical protein
VRPGQPEAVTQELHEQEPWLDVFLDASAVDRQGDGASHASLLELVGAMPGLRSVAPMLHTTRELSKDPRQA